MPLYRKKPIVISAVRWWKNGDHPEDYQNDCMGHVGGELRIFSAEERKIAGWEGDIVRYYRRPDDPAERLCSSCGNQMHDHGWMDTLEGGHVVCPGDWIITGVASEKYPCKDHVFQATYEPVDDAVAVSTT